MFKLVAVLLQLTANGPVDTGTHIFYKNAFVDEASCMNFFDQTDGKLAKAQLEAIVAQQGENDGEHYAVKYSCEPVPKETI